MHTKKIHHICTTDQCERDTDQAEKSLSYGMKCKIQAGEDDNEHNRQNNFQSPFSPDKVFILSAPFDVIAFRQNLDQVVELFLRFFNRTAQVPVAHIE